MNPPRTPFLLPWFMAAATAFNCGTYASEASRPSGTHSHRALGNSLDGIVADSKLSPEQIRLKKRFFSPVASRNAGITSLASDKDRHLLIQLEPGKADVALEKLKGRGITVLEYVPVGAVSAKVPAGVDPLSVEGVRWAGRMQADDKLSPVIDAQPGTKRLVVDLHPGASATEAAAAIARIGVPTRVLEKIPLNSLLVETDDAGAERIAQLDAVSYLFPAAKNLTAKVRRCPGPLTPAGPLAFYSLRGEGWDGQGANSISLTYRMDASVNGTANIPADTLRAEILRGITAWSQHAQINFSPTAATRASRSLEVFWGADATEPFDGPDGTLAYCYYPSPPVGEPEAGNMHFDPDENWRVGNVAGGVDVFSVALHEAGHGLGIAHSDVANAVMYPYYSFATGLQQDDINAITVLYARQGGGGGGGGGSGGGGAGGGASGGGDFFEPDNTSFTAKTIELNTQQSRSISPIQDVDYARFTLPNAANIEIATAGVAGDTRLFLYDNSLNQVAFNDDAGSGYFSRITRTNVPAGTYYALIDEYGNDAAIPSYQLSLQATLLGTSGDDFEPDDQADRAKKISAGERQIRSIGRAGDLDYAYFSLTQPSEVVIETSGTSGDTRMWLSSSSLSSIEFNDDGGAGLFSRIDRLTTDNDQLPAGTYYVLVNEYSNAQQIDFYNLDLTVVPLAGGDSDDAYEPNDFLSESYAPDFNWERTFISGMQGPGLQANEDWYEIDVWPPGYERVVAQAYFDSNEGDIDLALYDYRGRLVAVSQEAARDYEAVSVRVPRAGYYYLRVFYGNQGNSYDLYWDDLERGAPGPDTTPPNLRWSSPRSGAVLRRVATVAGTANDGTKVQAVYYRVDSGPFEEASYSQSTKRWSFVLDPSELPAGRSVPVSIFAEDTLGNTTSIQTRFYSRP